MTKDEYYIEIALTVAKKSKCLKKHFGAVIVNNDEIVATGYNGCARGEPECLVCTKIGKGKDEADYQFCPAIHAEQNAIICASRRDMLGGTLYLAGWNANTDTEFKEAKPCEICLRLIKNSGINRVVNSTGTIFERDINGILVQNIKGEE